MARLVAEQHEAAEARVGSARLVECQRSLGAYLAYCQIQATFVGDGFLIGFATLEHVLFRDIGIESMDVFLTDVHVVEKHFFHLAQRARAVGDKWEKFAETVEHHFVERNFAILVKLYQSCICAVGAHSGAECDHTFALILHIPVDDLGYLPGYIFASG